METVRVQPVVVVKARMETARLQPAVIRYIVRWYFIIIMHDIRYCTADVLQGLLIQVLFSRKPKSNPGKSHWQPSQSTLLYVKKQMQPTTEMLKECISNIPTSARCMNLRWKAWVYVYPKIDRACTDPQRLPCVVEKVRKPQAHVSSDFWVWCCYSASDLEP